MNAPAALGMTMPGSAYPSAAADAPMIMAQLKDVTAQAAATVSSWGLSSRRAVRRPPKISVSRLSSPSGGAPTLAVGIAHVFHKILPAADMGFWYHFVSC
ncbi:carbon starvation CstA family protein [Shigella flexneri]